MKRILYIVIRTIVCSMELYDMRLAEGMTTTMVVVLLLLLIKCEHVRVSVYNSKSDEILHSHMQPFVVSLYYSALFFILLRNNNNKTSKTT